MPDEQQVAMAAAMDMAAKQAMPSSVPEGYENYAFQVPDLPMMFTLVDTNDPTNELGPFQQEEFVTEPNGVTFAHDSDTGTPIVLRVITQTAHGQVPQMLTCIDDHSLNRIYIVREIPDSELEVDEP